MAYSSCQPKSSGHIFSSLVEHEDRVSCIPQVCVANFKGWQHIHRNSHLIRQHLRGVVFTDRDERLRHALSDQGDTRRQGQDAVVDRGSRLRAQHPLANPMIWPV